MQTSAAIPNAIIGNHGCLFTNVFEESDLHTFKLSEKIRVTLSAAVIYLFFITLCDQYARVNAQGCK